MSQQPDDLPLELTDDILDGELVEESLEGVEVPTELEDVQDLETMTAEQDAAAQKFAMDFLKKIIRLRGVRIDREKFLTQELRKVGVSNDVISQALRSTPIHAELTLAQLDSIADSTISFETTKSAAISFTAGLPGGLAMAATVPGDITQFYVHAFRVMQKLAYLYGWQDLLGDMDEADDETVGKLAVFLGVMMGVGGAANSLIAFSKQVARPAIQKQISQKALTKTAWYPVVKQTLKLVGVKVTKDSFAKTVTKVIPLLGGALSGTMTFATLRTQSQRLKDHLRELPPPGVDGAEYLAMVTVANDIAERSGSTRLADLGSSVKGVSESALGLAGSAAVSARDIAGTAAQATKEQLGSLGSNATGLAKGLRGRFAKNKDTDEDSTT